MARQLLGLGWAERARAKLRQSMKPISQFEASKPVSRTMTRLTALVTELRKEVCNLETSIEYEEDRASSVPARIFVARQLRARRDNLLLTISTLENQLKDPISLQCVGAVTRRRRPSANVEWLRSTDAKEEARQCREVGSALPSAGSWVVQYPHEYK